MQKQDPGAPAQTNPPAQAGQKSQSGRWSVLMTLAKLGMVVATPFAAYAAYRLSQSFASDTLAPSDTPVLECYATFENTCQTLVFSARQMIEMLGRSESNDDGSPSFVVMRAAAGLLGQARDFACRHLGTETSPLNIQLIPFARQ